MPDGYERDASGRGASTTPPGADRPVPIAAARRHHLGTRKQYATGQKDTAWETPEVGGLGPHFFYRELRQIPVTTDTSLVVSRHTSLYSTGYHSRLPAIASHSHYANTLF